MCVVAFTKLVYRPVSSHLLKARGMVVLRLASRRCPQNVFGVTFTDVNGTGVMGYVGLAVFLFCAMQPSERAEAVKTSKEMRWSRFIVL